MHLLMAHRKSRRVWNSTTETSSWIQFLVRRTVWFRSQCVLCTQAYFVLQLYLLSRPLAPNFLFEASECRFINEFSTVGFRFRPYIVDCFAIVHLTCRKMFETFPFLHVHYCPVLFLSMSKLFLQLGRLSVLYHLIGYLKFLLSKIAWQLWAHSKPRVEMEPFIYPVEEILHRPSPSPLRVEIMRMRVIRKQST